MLILDVNLTPTSFTQEEFCCYPQIKIYVIVWTLLVIDRQLVAFASQPGQCRLSLTSAAPLWAHVVLWYETGQNANL